MWQTWVLLAVLISVVSAQPPVSIAAAPPNADFGSVAANMQKFVEWYGLATQIMNLGGSFIGTNGPSSERGSSRSYGSGNDVYSDIRPVFRGVRNYDPDSILMRGEDKYDRYSDRSPSSSSGLFGMAPLFGGGSSSSPSAEEYGGGPLGGRGSAPRTGALEALLNGFLGSSVTDPPPRPRRTRNLYDADGGSNIDGILGMLMRSGARPAEPEPPSYGGFLSQFFGKK